MAVRTGAWKVHYFTQGSYGTEPKARKQCSPPELYNLEIDPSEQFNVAKEHPEILALAEQAVVRHRAQLIQAPTQLEH